MKSMTMAFTAAAALLLTACALTPAQMDHARQHADRECRSESSFTQSYTNTVTQRFDPHVNAYLYCMESRGFKVAIDGDN